MLNQPDDWVIERDAKREVIWLYSAEDDDRSMQCGITLEALQHVHGQGHVPLQAIEAFEPAKAAVRQIFSQKHSTGQFEPDGSLIIRLDDF